MKTRYGGQGFQVISVHTPEFEYEKERRRVERAVERYKLDQPVYMDNDYAYWNALGNRYWPAFYLVDKQGRIRLAAAGEMHDGTSRGAQFEELIRTLLAEPS
jgi:hypothetical protein